MHGLAALVERARQEPPAPAPPPAPAFTSAVQVDLDGFRELLRRRCPQLVTLELELDPVSPSVVARGTVSRAFHPRPVTVHATTTGRSTDEILGALADGLEIAIRDALTLK
jgi:hypothetical protein